MFPLVITTSGYVGVVLDYFRIGMWCFFDKSLYWCYVSESAKCSVDAVTVGFLNRSRCGPLRWFYIYFALLWYFMPNVISPEMQRAFKHISFMCMLKGECCGFTISVRTVRSVFRSSLYLLQKSTVPFALSGCFRRILWIVHFAFLFYLSVNVSLVAITVKVVRCFA